jgi:2-iminoacetate synthase
MTLSEYLADYATPATAQQGWRVIADELAKIPDAHRREQCARNVEAIRKGEGRDFRF